MLQGLYVRPGRPLLKDPTAKQLTDRARHRERYERRRKYKSGLQAEIARVTAELAARQKVRVE